ncbi:facilitated trehalose transporter Tret1-like isoform X2 [Pieris rapae]|uniref:facilitated trehalose transporter Tret1-like isoform X2 n=1 Tax=Pieris rapae TaxID=64459 RepID=UPI001E27DE77|nr:facilitated trehalose transporter Tret1-like isoform X2 [Pieris rapae]
MSGKVKTSALLVQTLATFSIAYLTGLTGFIYAWPSYTYETFTTNKTVLSAPLTPTQMSLLGSLTNIGGLIGTPLCALVIDRIGRRYSAMLFGLPYVEATESIAFYRRVGVDSKEVELEINKIKMQLDPRFDLMLQSNEDANAVKHLLEKPMENAKKEPSWKFLMKSESSKGALFAVLFLMGINILMGSIVLQVYAEPLFKEAVPTMHPNLCSILLAVDYLAAALVCAFVIDKFGRKSLMTVTSIASGFFNILLGSQLQFHWAPHWFTAFVIYAYSFVFNLGAAVVPFVLTAEVFLPEVRGICSSLSMVCMWVMNFVTLIIFNPLVDQLGLGPTFYFFSIICFIGGTYSHLWLPETKGLSADQIQPLFMKKKTRNT